MDIVKSPSQTLHLSAPRQRVRPEANDSHTEVPVLAVRGSTCAYLRNNAKEIAIPRWDSDEAVMNLPDSIALAIDKRRSPLGTLSESLTLMLEPLTSSTVPSREESEADNLACIVATPAAQLFDKKAKVVEIAET